MDKRENATGAVVLAFANHKGGVAKSSATVAVAAELAARHYKVLVIDSDPQGNASQQLGVDLGSGLELEENEAERPLSPASLLYLGRRSIADLAGPCLVPGVDLVAASLELNKVGSWLTSQHASEMKLRRALAPIKNAYDIILCDTPPNLDRLTVNALVASEFFIAPFNGAWALKGILDLREVVQANVEAYGPSFHSELLGVLLTMMSNTNIMSNLHNVAFKLYPDALFTTTIPASTVAREAEAIGQPVTVYSPSSKLALAYKTLTDEILERLALS